MYNVKCQHNDLGRLNINTIRNINSADFQTAANSSIARLISLPAPCQSRSIIRMPCFKEKSINHQEIEASKKLDIRHRQPLYIHLRRKGSTCKGQIYMRTWPRCGSGRKERLRINQNDTCQLATLVESVAWDASISNIELYYFCVAAIPDSFRCDDCSVIWRLNLRRRGSGKRGSIKRWAGQGDRLDLKF